MANGFAVNATRSCGANGTWAVLSVYDVCLNNTLQNVINYSEVWKGASDSTLTKGPAYAIIEIIEVDKKGLLGTVGNFMISNWKLERPKKAMDILGSVGIQRSPCFNFLCLPFVFDVPKRFNQKRTN